MRRRRSSLASAREGQSGALVLRGDAGVGKSALVDYAAVRAEGLRVLRTTEVQAESELPFAALHLLLIEVKGAVEDLDPVYRRRWPPP